MFLNITFQLYSPPIPLSLARTLKRGGDPFRAKVEQGTLEYSKPSLLRSPLSHEMRERGQGVSQEIVGKVSYLLNHNTFILPVLPKPCTLSLTLTSSFQETDSAAAEERQ